MKETIIENDNQELHVPVLLKESIDCLINRSDGVYADLTFGLGGHSKAILKKLEDGRLIAFDWDNEQIEIAKKDSFFFRSDFNLIEDNFINFSTRVDSLGIKKLNGILLDLGLSSLQLKCFHRGLSFRMDAPLDMRISCGHNSLTAKHVINNYSSDKLTNIFKVFGEERLAPVIAKKIVKRRAEGEIKTTQELVGIIASCFVTKKKKHPARKVFQALRIYLNKELENLSSILGVIFDYLDIKGRIVIISYNSLEDRIIKRIFKEKEKTGNYLIINKKVIVPKKEEILKNNRARSAKMRVIERI